MRTLNTTRCILEPLCADHAETMFEVLSDPAIYEFENEAPLSAAWLRERYQKLERRSSPDGGEKWLNWVLRLPDGALAGYVQATVLPRGLAYVAYELNSRYWRQGLGSSAVAAMIEELHQGYGVRSVVAVLKAANYRSLALLRSLGFSPCGADEAVSFGPEPDEVVMRLPRRPAGQCEERV